MDPQIVVAGAGAAVVATTAIRRLAVLVEKIIQPSISRHQAEADAHGVIVKAEAFAVAKTIEQRAIHRAEVEQIRHQHNLESIVEHTRLLLNETEQAQVAPSSEELDEDWFDRFTSLARGSSDSDIKSLWAKVLAGQLRQPGRYSLRLLNMISMLRKRDAVAFATMCNYVWHHYDGRRYLVYSWKTCQDYLSKKFGLDRKLLQLFDELGLVHYGGTIRGPDSRRSENYWCHFGQAYSIPVVTIVGGHPVNPMPLTVELTHLGGELMDLCTLEIDKDYLERLEWGRTPVIPAQWLWPNVKPAK